MRIGGRLVLNTALIAFFSVIITSSIVGWSAYYLGKKAIEKKATEQLISLRESKKEEIERYFNTIRNQIITLADDLMIVNAMDDFKRYYKTYKQEAAPSKKGKYDFSKVTNFLKEYVKEYKKENGEDQSVDTKLLLNFSNESSFLLQYNYIIDNPNPVSEKYLLNTVNDGTQYSATHKKYHPIIRSFLEKFGYYDIFLIDADTGDIVYTVAKEVDFASNLKTGVSQYSGLNTIFNNVIHGKDTQTFIADFQPYLASYNEQAAFIATPIYKDNVLTGVLVLQFPVNIINSIMTFNEKWQEVGLGETGETYLVGSNYRLRSTSRFFLENPTEYIKVMKEIGLPESIITMMKDKKTTVGLQPVLTEGTKTVFETHEPGFSIFPDYRDIPVLSAYTPLDIPGLNWALMSEQDVSEAFEAISTLAKSIIIATVIIALTGLIISIVIGAKLSRNISIPIVHLNHRIRKIAQEMDLTKKIPVISTDEIGEVTVALNYLIENFRDTLQETVSSSEKMLQAGDELRSISKMVNLSEEEQREKLGNTEKDLQDLSVKLRSLSGQFKILEEKYEEEEDW